MVKQPTITINGSEIQEGDTVNRLGNVTTRGGDFRIPEESPHELLQEAAEDILDKLPDQVEADSAAELAENIADDPSLLDELGGVKFHSMKVTSVEEGQGSVPSRIAFRDWKTGGTGYFDLEDIDQYFGTVLFVTT